MKIEITVEFNKEWLAARQDNRSNPVRLLSYHLRRKNGIEIVEFKDNILKIAFLEKDISDAEVLNIIYDYMEKRYPQEDIRNIIWKE